MERFKSQLPLDNRNADAHRDNGKRFIVSADEKLTAFLELERQLSDGCGMIKADY
jgi:hypothetical protein